jgi:hypothetical protein
VKQSKGLCFTREASKRIALKEACPSLPLRSNSQAGNCLAVICLSVVASLVKQAGNSFGAKKQANHRGFLLPLPACETSKLGTAPPKELL